MVLYALVSALNDIIARSQSGQPLTRRDLAVLRLFDGLTGTAFAAAGGLYLQYGPHTPLLDLLVGSLGTGLAGAFLRWRNSPDGQLVLDDGTTAATGTTTATTTGTNGNGGATTSPTPTAAPTAPVLPAAPTFTAAAAAADPGATQPGVLMPRIVPVTAAATPTTSFTLTTTTTPDPQQ